MRTARDLGIAVAALGMTTFLLVPIGFAQDEGHTARHPGGAMESMDTQSQMPMMAQMQTMAKVKADLEEAKGAAEAKGDKMAAAKIDDALELLEQSHQAMHQHMARMMQMMKQRMENMQAMEQQMQKMQEELGKSPQTRSMQGQMQEMVQKMQQMREQMHPEAMAGQKQCPMCSKMMAEPAKPSMGGTAPGSQPSGMHGMMHMNGSGD